MTNCRFPEHHGGSGGVGPWMAALVVGAVVVGFWHVAVVALVIVAGLAVAGLIVLLSWRAHRTLPYDAAWQDDLPVPAHIAAHRYTAETVIPERRHASDYLPVAGTLPVAELHQHVHLHGLDAGQLAEVAALLRRSGGALEPDAGRLAIEQHVQPRLYQDTESEPVNQYRP